MSIQGRVTRLERARAAEAAELSRQLTLECRRVGPEATREVLEEVAEELSLGRVTDELVGAIMRGELCR